VDVESRQGVISLGTSGAIRANVKNPTEPLPENFFCYQAVPGGGLLLGEAYSNIGSLWAFLAALFKISVEELIARGLARLRQSEDSLPILIPFLYGERSPYWDEGLSLEWQGVRPHHQSDDFLASAVAAVLTGIYGGSSRLREAIPQLEGLKSGSRLLENPDLAQWVANASGVRLAVDMTVDASLWGAVRLAGNRAPLGPAQEIIFEPEPVDRGLWEERLDRQERAAKAQIERMGDDHKDA
jgi:gluconokinase